MTPFGATMATKTPKQAWFGVQFDCFLQNFLTYET